MFFSKLNRDSYTRRCFEIPATKMALVSEYSNDLQSLFRDKKEIFYSQAKKEFIKIIDCLLANKKLVRKSSIEWL